MENYNRYFYSNGILPRTDNSQRRENFEARSCSGPAPLRKIKANSLMKFVLTDHHILILKVLQIFSHIKFIVHSSPKFYSPSKLRSGVTSLESLFRISQTEGCIICVPKTLLVQVCKNNLLNYSVSSIPVYCCLLKT